MKRRIKRLVNYEEEKAFAILEKVAKEYGARVFTKTRVADVLDLESSGISDGDFSYGLKAHFDLVVCGVEMVPLFAVEFDGPHHQFNKRTQINDQRKDRICETVGFPLLRVTAEFLDVEHRKFNLLAWLSELWFLKQAFEKAQEEGQIPWEEDFLYWSFFDIGEKGLDACYDLAFPAKVYLNQACKLGKVLYPTPMYLTAMSQGWRAATSIAMLHLGLDGVLIGERVRCDLGNFDAVSARDLAEDLALVNVADKLKQYLARKVKPISMEEAKAIKAKWEEQQRAAGGGVSTTGLLWMD